MTDEAPERRLGDITQDIRKAWRKKDGTPSIYFGAMPYLEAMEHVGMLATYKGLDDRTLYYGLDPIRDIVMYFLSNATTFRGDVARQVKAELKRKYGIK